MTSPSHYEILSLPQTLLDESKDDQIPTIVKQAYHRALLRHHPDKAPLKPTSTSPYITTTTATYTIDQITTAYTTLSQPSFRAAYNTHLRTLPKNNTASTASTFQTGIETLDLDDLASEETDSSTTGPGTTWYKPCRCGNERGFVFREEDLEEAGDLGELIVGCQDCSLWLRVCFVVVDEEKEAERADDRTGGFSSEAS